MLSIDDLRAAGERAAAQPVVPGPTIATLEREVARRKNRHRATLAVSAVALTAAGGVAAVAVLGPSGAPVEVVADQLDGAAGIAAPAPVQPAGDRSPTVGGAPADDDPADDDPGSDGPEGPDGYDGSWSVEIDGGMEITIRVVGGDRSGTVAAEAAATADEIRAVDGVEVWIEPIGERVVVSALVEPDRFVQVTGPGELVDWLSVVVTGDGRGDDGPPLPRLRDLVPDELFPGLRDLDDLDDLDELDDLEDLDELDDLDDLDDLDELDDLEDLDELELRLESLTGSDDCAHIELHRSGGRLRIEPPDGCGDG